MPLKLGTQDVTLKLGSQDVTAYLGAESVSAFDPTSIEGLGLWLDASKTSSLTFNATTVSEWRDLSGNGRDFAEATAGNQPGTRTLGTRQALDFGGSAWLIGNAASLSIARNVGGLTIFIAGELDATDSARVFLNISRNGSLAQARALLDFDSSSQSFRAGGRRTDADSFVGVISGASVTTDPVVLTGVYNYGASDLFLYVSGSLLASTTSFQVDGNTSDTDSNGVSIGQSGLATSVLDGAIGEILVYQRALSAAERQVVEQALGKKWGIAVA